jgi:predicted nucleic acid-binding protein
MLVRATLDSNILVYAELDAGQFKGETAKALITMTASHGVIASQALLEFIAVVRRRLPDRLPSAVAKGEALSAVFATAPTTRSVVSEALRIVAAHRFQVWDAVILAASRAAGATLFFSEDLQDGLVLDGVRIVNPFIRSQTEWAALLDLS